jgi:myotubularin-related protein 1/2
MFTQVARTSKAVEHDLLDPLSMFAMQDAKQKVEDEKEATVSRTQAATPSGTGSTATFSKDELKVPIVQQPQQKKVEVRPSVVTQAVPTPTPQLPVTSAANSPKPRGSHVSQPSPTPDDEILLKSLSGEQKIMSILDSYITVATGEVISGTLFMTNYRLVFIPSSTDLTSIAITNPSVHSYLQVPISAIDKIDREKRGKDMINAAISVVIHCKDFRQLRITIRNTSKSNTGDYDIERAINLIAAYAFPNNMRYLFAFTHRLSGIQARDLAEPYDAALEFSRLGVLDNPAWRVTNANATYRLCNTYPQWLVVPASMSDEDLHAVAGFRSGHRLPAMCWADRESGATMWRCSQPKAGVSGTCSQDERMLDLIARSCVGGNAKHRAATKKYSNEGILNIVDCRSRASAMANRAAGAGYESQTNYPSSRLEFYSISNIHAVRDMYKGLASFILGAAPGASVDLNFTKMFEDTQWLNSIRSILKASYDTAASLNNGTPALVHCSHGWDRTAQVCALAQLMLDPYYRTFEGFKVLVEKEWVSFGHAFQMRCAHSQDKATRAEDQVSQVMIQFLDCVWQLHRQCVQYFEFNARYILVVADHIYSGRFGTFLFSSDCERVRAAPCTLSSIV